MWRDWIISDWIGNIGWSWRRAAPAPEPAAVSERDNATIRWIAKREPLIEAYKNGEDIDPHDLSDLRLSTCFTDWMVIAQARQKSLNARKMELTIYRGALRLRALQVRTEKQRPIVREKFR